MKTKSISTHNTGILKTITKPIPEFQEDQFFAPTRDKTDFAKVVLNAAKLLLLNFSSPDIPSVSQLKLIVSKMTRLFIYTDKKYFSVAFPFNIDISGDEVLSIRTYRGKAVDSRSIAFAFSFLENDTFLLQPEPSLFAIDCSPSEALGLSLLEELFLLEPGYIRYDIDPENENGKLHPLVHLDINYSSYSTYKLGLHKEISEDLFEDIVDILTDCSFLVDGDIKVLASK